MAIEAPVPFGAAQLDAGPNNLESQTRLAKFFSDRKAFDLCKVSEKSNAKASCGFVANVTNQVSCREIVAIELFFVGALLLPDIDGASDRCNPHHILKRAGDRYRKALAFGCSVISVVKRWIIASGLGTAIHMQLRCGHALEGGAGNETRGLQNATPVERDRAREQVGPGIQGRGNFLENQRNSAR